MEAPNPNKRLRTVPSFSSSSSGQIQNPNPNSFLNVPDFNQNDVDLIVSSILSLPDSSPLSIGCSFDRALEKQLFEASGNDDSVQDRLTDRSLQLFSILHESAKRCNRKRATLHNSNSWFILPELTVKVFSKLDTKSLMQASSCCTMFNKYAKDPLCYSHIDLTTAFEHVDDRVLGVMIHRAGKELRSLKLGRVSCPNLSITPLLTKSCLDPLSFNHGFIGNFLDSLHLYNIRLEYEPWCDVLSACSNLTDLKIVGLNNAFPLDKVLESLSRKCEHLFIETNVRFGSLLGDLYAKTPFGRNFPELISLSLIGFALNDSEFSLLIKNFRKLKYLNLSTSWIHGSFLSGDYGDTLLETLLLRDCHCLEEEQVLVFLDSLCKGNFLRSIRYIDVSSKCGLSIGLGGYCKPKFCLEKLKEKRPGLTFVADFTSSPSSLGDASAFASRSWPEEYQW